MDVILIGDNTYGKNVGSVTLSDDKKRWKWGMQPIVLRTVNSLGQSEFGGKDGFIANFKVTDNAIPFRPFGDENETLLSAYPLDNHKHEIRDMFIDKLPGQK
jgi:hypothetical protein